MTTWTDSARAALEDYLTRLRATIAASGADPVEVTDDLRRHVAEEAAASKLEVVTAEDVSRILARIGPAVTPATPPTNAPEPARPAPPPEPRLYWFAAILGIPYAEIMQAALIPVAYTLGTDFKPGPRLSLESLVHWEQW